MKHTVEKFDIYPLVFPADQTAEIKIKALFQHVDFASAENIRIEYNPILHCRERMTPQGWARGDNVDFTVENGEIVIKQFLQNEQEHGFIVYTNDEPWLQFNVYSLKDDLLKLRPYKGDFHIHSIESDGRECPEYVGVSAREIGFDFMALTDHRKYEPSLRVKEFVESIPSGLKVFPGEEIHLENNPVHIVNFGSSFSVNDASNQDLEKYRKEVDDIAKTLPAEVPKQVKLELASSEWAYDKIREGGGLAMFCHPYWRPEWFYNYIWEDCIDWMFKRSKFDILELLGGFYRNQAFSNNESTARYTLEMAKSGGKVNWAVAGVSDAHGCDRDLFGWYYTVLFSENCEFDSLKSAFKAQRSVAVKAITNECPEIYGELRYVRYADFLMKKFFPMHDSLCALEGNFMKRHLAGEQGMPELIRSLPGRINELYSKYWAV